MAGIYIHIPFCHKACSYCDFHFSTNLKLKENFVNALCEEAKLRYSFFPDNTTIDTLYFGGGTPSILSLSELKQIVDVISNTYTVSNHLECTIECNPEDLTIEKVVAFKTAGINRLSIGIQSFFDSDLKLINRNHTASQSVEGVKIAQNAGIKNITIDLIYGIPGMGMKAWQDNVMRAIELNINHISAYALTVEPKTQLHHQVKINEIELPEDDIYREQYFYLVEKLSEAGFEHYELSNFAKKGMQSRHNSAYWEGKAYLGLGPSAHSFIGNERSWNIANNHAYIRNLNSQQLPVAETETLSRKDLVNEYLLTHLRKISGINTALMKENWEHDIWKENNNKLRQWIQKGLMISDGNNLKLSLDGLLLSNAIISELFIA